MSLHTATLTILAGLRTAAASMPPNRFGGVVPAQAPGVATTASKPGHAAPAPKRVAKRCGSNGQHNVPKLAPMGWRLSLLRKRSANAPYKHRRVSETKRLRRLATKAWGELDMLKPALTACRRKVADLARDERLQRITVEDARKGLRWFDPEPDELRHARTELGRIAREHDKARTALGELNYQWKSLVDVAHSAYRSATAYSACGMLYIDEVMDGKANTRAARLAYRSPNSDWRMLFDAGVRKGLKKRLNKQARKAGYRSAMLDFDDEMTPTPGETREAQRIARAEAEQAAAYDRMMEREIQAMLDEDIWADAA